VLLSTPINIGAVRGGRHVRREGIRDSHNICAISLNMNYVLMCKARLGEQNEGTRSVIRLPHKVIGVSRVKYT
jgi:hypothetical protein